MPKYLRNLKEAVWVGRWPGLDKGHPNGAIGLEEVLRELLHSHKMG